MGHGGWEELTQTEGQRESIPGNGERMSKVSE